MSSFSAREKAFLLGQYLEPEWTARFTKIVDEHLPLPKEGDFLYIEPGAGSHAVALREGLPDQVTLTCLHSDIELQNIARAKAETFLAKMDFRLLPNSSLTDLNQEFTTILADASFVEKGNLLGLMQDLSAAAAPGADVAFFLPTAGSYGEFFSLLWEALYNAGMADLGSEVEKQINALPTVSDVEDIAEAAGLKKVKSITKKEIFDYRSAGDLAASPFITEFLFPRWLGFLSEAQKEKIVPELLRTIDKDRESLTFRFTVKATVVTAKK